MIFDSAKYLDQYKNLGIEGRYAKAVEFLKNTDLENLSCGRHEIDGDFVYVNVMEYTTMPWEEAKYEAHRDYTDIQYMIKGSETMTYAPAADLKAVVPYNADKDVVLFDNSNPGLKIPVKAGEFTIFAPQDGHKPKALYQSAGYVKKAVVKIREV